MAGSWRLVPGDNPFQVIDARDLADFVVWLAHGHATGTFHTVSPRPPFSFADFLGTVVERSVPPGTELVWVDAEVLDGAGVTAAELPLLGGLAPGRDVSAADPEPGGAGGTTAAAAGPDRPDATSTNGRTDAGERAHRPRPGSGTRAARVANLTGSSC